MKFSLCVPNFNYAAYLKATMESVLQQKAATFEICIADNNSTDGSQALIEAYAARHACIKYTFNQTNLGFSDNLLTVSQMADGDWQILLSSDDLMKADTLNFYQRFIETIGPEKKFAFSSSCDKIDGEGINIGYLGPRSKIWRRSDMDIERSTAMGCDVYRVASGEMLQRVLSTFYGPFHFAATCYSTRAYAQAGGYIGGRMYNPDKWFHWRLLTVVDEVFYLDKPAFAYRWHTQNQAALQQKSRALKYLVDEYRNTIEVTPEMRAKASMSQEALERNFIEEVVVKNAFAAIKNAQRHEARRALDFGKAAFPLIVAHSKRYWVMRVLLFFGPIGTCICQIFQYLK